MKRVFLYAYDKINLGDDLFITFITKRYPDTKFYLWTDIKNKKIFRNLKNLKVINKNSYTVRLIKKVRASLVARYKIWWEKRCNAFVYIGGSIFMEYKAWENLIIWLNNQAENHHFFILGANFGPYKTQDYKKKLGEVFFKMEDVCFRDKYSVKEFDGNFKVRYAPDILFAYPMPVVSIKSKQIFVSIINCSGRDEEYDLGKYNKGYVRNMTNILQQYLNDGYSLILSSFCREEGDEEGIQKIVNKLQHEEDSKIQILNYNGMNVERILNSIAESEYIIGTRFHAVILAMAAGRPVLPIIYSNKTKNVLEDIEFGGVVFDLRRDEVWNYAKSRRNLDFLLPIISGKVKKDSEDHFLKLDVFLKYGERNI